MSKQEQMTAVSEGEKLEECKDCTSALTLSTKSRRLANLYLDMAVRLALESAQSGKLDDLELIAIHCQNLRPLECEMEFVRYVQAYSNLTWSRKLGFSAKLNKPWPEIQPPPFTEWRREKKTAKREPKPWEEIVMNRLIKESGTDDLAKRLMQVFKDLQTTGTAGTDAVEELAAAKKAIAKLETQLAVYRAKEAAANRGKLKIAA